MERHSSATAGLEAAPVTAAPDGKGSRAQWVYDTLRAGIRGGQYARAERIREEEVARTLGVSRTPVREALSRLQARGLLEVAPGGLVVASLTRPQIHELYAMREVLEGSAARFVAQHASPSDIATLRRLATLFERSIGSPSKLADVNREFHSAIYEASKNRYLLRTLDQLNDALALLPSTTFTVPGRPERAVEEHAQILAAIGRGDADSAEHLARVHIQHAQEARLEMMFQLR